MKFLVSIIVLTVLSITNSVTAQNKTVTANNKTITATVVNVSSEKGKVSFALYNEATFMMKPLESKSAKIVEGKSTVTFENLKEGEYSIICFHDKNDNDKMDFSPNRMPLEDYGASNNAMAFAPPTFEASKFMLTAKNVELAIKF